MTLRQSRAPEGYKQLLAYQKAAELQEACAAFTSRFSLFAPSPHYRTLMALADQMDRSARSVKQNIVEGWKRNSTKEYYDFLRFSLGANAELQEDCDDIIKGRYEMGGTGLKREEWEEEEEKGERGGPRRRRAEEDRWFEKKLEEQGLVRLANARLSLFLPLFPFLLFSALLPFSTLVLFPSAAEAALTRPPNNLGLVGYWPLDEGGGTSVFDHSGEKVNGVIVNPPATWVAGKQGGALSLSSASGQQIQATSSAAVQYSTTQCGWIKLNSYNGGNFAGVSGTGAGGTILSTRGGTAGASGASIQIAHYHLSANKAVFIFNANGDAVGAAGNTTIALHTWYFICGVFSYTGAGGTFGGNWTVYVNGVEDDSAANNYPAVGGSSFPMNGTTWTIGGIDGIIDDVRIYNRALSAADVSRFYQLGPAQVASPTTLLTNGLVGYWTFDGKNMVNNVADSSGNGNNGSLVGFTSTTTAETLGKVGQALTFNGTNQAMSTPAINLSSNSVVTLAFWYKGQYSTEHELFESSVNFNNNVGAFIVNVNDKSSGTTCANVNKFEVAVRSVTNYLIDCVAQPTNTAIWHHWAAVMDTSTAAGSIKIYLDGVLQSATQSQNGSGSTNFGNFPIYLMSRAGISSFAPGTLDDVRIYNRALSATEVQELYQAGLGTTITPAAVQANGPAPANLVGYWTFNQKDTNWATGVTLDKSGNGNNGSLIAMSTTTSPVEGKLGQALKFNGTNQYVNMPDTGLPTGDRTMTAWFKTSMALGTNSYASIVEYGTEGLPVGRMSQMLFSNDGGSGNTMSFAASQYGDEIATPGFNDGKWHFGVITVKGSTWTIYMDGIAKASKTMTTGTVLSGSARIGQNLGSAQPFNGAIDDVRIYNTALTAAQVLQLYNATK